MVSILALSFLVFHADLRPHDHHHHRPHLRARRRIAVGECAQCLREPGAGRVASDYLGTAQPYFPRFAFSAQRAWNRRGLRARTGPACYRLRRPRNRAPEPMATGISRIVPRTADTGSRPSALWTGSHLLTFLPYYFLVIGATGLLCWLAAVGVVSPIRANRLHHCAVRAGRSFRARRHQARG